MSTTIAEIPAADTAKVSPFKAAMEAAFKDVPDVEMAPKETSAPKAEPKADTPPKSAEAKTGVPAEFLPKTEPKKEAAPAVESDDIGIPEPPKLDAKGKAGWEAAKAKIREQTNRLSEFERTQAEWKSKGRDPETLEKQLAERDKKLADYEALVARANLELTDSFQKEVLGPKNEQLEKARKFADEVDIDPDTLAKALEKTGKDRTRAIDEISEGLSQVQAGRLGRIVEKIDELDERAAHERANAKQSHESRLEKDRKAKIEQEANTVKERFLEFEQTARALKADHIVLNHADGYESWNADADAIVRDARAAVEANPNTNIKSEIEARTAPIYRRLFNEANDLVSKHEAKIAEMEAELKAIHSKGPGITRLTGTPAQDGERRKGFSEMLGEAFGQ